MTDEYIPRSQHAFVCWLTATLALLVSGMTMKIAVHHPDSIPHAVLAVALFLSMGLLWSMAAYCIYLSLAAVRSGQFPAPRAFLPVRSKVRRGSMAAASAFLMASVAVCLLLLGVVMLASAPI